MATIQEIIEAYERIMIVYRRLYPLPEYEMVTAATKDAVIVWNPVHTTADSVHVKDSSTTFVQI